MRSETEAKKGPRARRGGKTVRGSNGLSQGAREAILSAAMVNSTDPFLSPVTFL